ncbi:PHD finger family protein [Tripterygium wilfordii]|uniref:PHD finger family protein n=1 Tax=Tripterygium wilfordii TaxID=458696 RepID=A0A7J7CA84_TRIWF|nr:protein Jade-1 [Tripterygium wilfordii]KAF5730777.1 PHD finger family protein [Tripterygium wilfordii]
MKMDATFQSLPPLKRFRLQQQQERQQKEKLAEEENKENMVIPSTLPAKKRRESREPLAPCRSAATTTTYNLPAKKRVWAMPPDLVLEMPFSPIDLNVEYKPSIDEEVKVTEEIPLADTANQSEVKEVSGLENIGESFENSDISLQEQNEEISDDEDDGIVCAICKSTDGDPSDPIVFCDGCNLMAHSTCYGDPLIKGIPEGDWFCAQCLASRSSEDQNQEKPAPFSCCLCPVKEGAMKPTSDGRWAHILCSLFVPEVFFEDPTGREGVNCSMVPKRRFEERCYVCMSSSGCAIDCSEPKCLLAFHVTCGLNEDLIIEYKEGKKKAGAVVAGFCKDHSELWKKQQQTGKFKIVAREEHQIS